MNNVCISYFYSLYIYVCEDDGRQVDCKLADVC